MTDLSEFTRKKWRPARHVWPIMAAACLGLAVAVASWFAVSVWEERLAKAKFVALASDYATVLQNGLDDYLGKLLAVRAFYDASYEVDPDEFAVFTKQITRGYDDTMRLVWAPRVTRDQRAAFEQEVRATDLTDFNIRTWAPNDPIASSPPRDEYFPILFSTVASKRTATYGTDLNSEEVRSQAIRRARDSDKIATAQGIVLRNQISGSREGFLAVIPAYRHGLPHDTIEDRRRNTLGVIVGAFQTGAVIDSILRKAKLAQDVDLYLYPKNAAPGAQPVYTREQAFGGTLLTQEIARHYGMSVEEAEVAKRAGTLPEAYRHELLRPFLDSLALETSRALQFFFTSTQYNQVDYLVLAGGCAVMPGLADVVRGRTQVETLVANPFAGMAQSTLVRPKSLLADAPSLMVACGLALRRFDA